MNLGLAADIGSTNARFGLARPGPNRTPVLSDVAVFPCRDFPNIDAAIAAYLSQLPADAKPTAGTLAIAGPIAGDNVKLTNNPWHFSIAGLRKQIGFAHLSIINDFAAISLSLMALPTEGMVSIGPQADLRLAQRLGVIGPGSGLGVGGLIRYDGLDMPIPSEGGHVNFSAQTEREWAIARRLQAKFGHVSNERLLSGPGLVNLYESLAEIDGRTAAPLRDADIVHRAIDNTDPTCREALEHFCDILGSAAGDLALLLYADAVFIAGGIVPRFVDVLKVSEFRKRFEAKGRYAAHLAEVPTLVITEKYAGLIGAAVHLLQRKAD